MNGDPAPLTSGSSMPRWWKALFLTGAMFLAVGLVATLWVDGDRDPAPVSGLETDSEGG